MKITIVGSGYVGLSLSILLSQFHKVIALDIDKNKIKQINKRISPIDDKDIIHYLKNKKLNLTATDDKVKAYSDCDCAIICTPTNYHEETNQFDTSSVESIIKYCKNLNRDFPILIKSTIPVGYTERIKEKYMKKNIIFSPEFLREGKALYDNLYPSRIIVGGKCDDALMFKDLLLQISQISENSIPIETMGSNEAESVKLFSNTYLAMRIAFFNELDSFCEIHSIETKDVIKGVSYDPRIGNYYNNPSFGYGGYCLPKDTRQLLKNYDNVPNNIIQAIVDANRTRKDFIADRIISKNYKTIGIYKLVMKEGSDNIRDSAIQGIMKRIKAKGIEVIVYEPKINREKFFGSKVIKNIDEFKQKSELIVANRISNEISSLGHKIYTRDIFREN